MSFRNRLTVFFIVLVILPMVVVAAVGFALASDSEEGKTDARLGQARTTAEALYQQYQHRAQAAARTIGQDPALAGAIQDGKRPALQRRLAALAREAGAVRVTMSLARAGDLQVGSGEAVAYARTRLIGRQGRSAGLLTVSVIGAEALGSELRRLTRTDVVIRGPSGPLFSTFGGNTGRAPLPDEGEVQVGGRTLRVATVDAPASGGGRIAVRVFAAPAGGGLGRAAVEVLAILLAALVAAFAFAITVSRSLQAQIQRLLDAAEALGKGDFAVEVPTEGKDEFARLGREFNKMARQLETRLDELELERARLREAIQRSGRSFSRALDPGALLEVAVQTAIDGVGAHAGRAALRTDGQRRFEEVAGEGDVGRFRDAIGAAETAALDAGETVERAVEDAFALSHPLRAQDNRILGMLSVARTGEAFTEGERHLLAYLAGHTGLSVENADLHDTVKRQAVTDELTGLFNHRRFREAIANEVERSKRGGPPVGLVMFDIDNFKRVNDTYGHMQGDFVLREVARVLRENSREIDEPARYGGEEMAVALPGTDLDGAYLFAERVRRSIESLELPLMDGDGMLRVTASFGVAALVDADEKAKADDLVAAVDAALYRAKRSGKNRTVRAE